MTGKRPHCGPIGSVFPSAVSGASILPMPSLVIDVRPARPADAVELAEVYAAAWREAYSGIIPALTLERMIVRRNAGWWREMVGRRSILVLDVGGVVAGYSSFAPMHGRTQ